MSTEIHKLKFLCYILKAQSCLIPVLFFTLFIKDFLGFFPAEWNLSSLPVHITGERCDLSTRFLLFSHLTMEFCSIFYSLKFEETCTLPCPLSSACGCTLTTKQLKNTILSICLTKNKNNTKRSLSFYYCISMSYFNLLTCALSNPVSQIAKQNAFLCLFFQADHLFGWIFSLITLFFHHVVSASSALLILSVCPCFLPYLHRSAALCIIIPFSLNGF